MGYLHDNVGKRTRVPLRPSHSLISRRYIPVWINENIAFLIESALLRLTRSEHPSRGFSRGRNDREGCLAVVISTTTSSHASLPVKDQRQKDFDVFPRD